MKKIFFLVALFISVSLVAQTPMKLNTNDLRSLSGTASVNADRDNYTFTDEQVPEEAPSVLRNTAFVGNTYWPAQTNATYQKLLVAHDDGTVSVAFHTSGSSTASRGTGYNFFDGNTWGANSNERVETVRAGYSAMASLGASGVIIVSHNGSNGLIINRKTDAQNGSWNETVLTGPEQTSSTDGSISTALYWPVVATVGDTVHIFAHGESTEGFSYNGVSNPMLYYRSTDGGNTWDIQHQFLTPDMISDPISTSHANAYQISAQPGCVAILFGSKFTDLMLYKSYDGGNTWNKTVVFDSPIPHNLDFDIDYFDTTFVPNGVFALTLDDNNNAHLAFGVIRVLRDASNEAGYYSYFWGYNCMTYWNETMPVYPSTNAYQTLNPDVLQGVYPTFTMPNLTSEDTLFTWNSSYATLPAYKAEGFISQPNLVAQDGEVYLVYTAALEYPFIDASSSQYWRGIFATKSLDNGATWNDDDVSWISYAPNVFQIDWEFYNESLEATDPAEAMIEAVMIDGENVYASVSEKIVNNKIHISWLNDYFSGLEETFPAQNAYNVAYKMLDKTQIGVYNNVNEVYTGIWNSTGIQDNLSFTKMAVYPNPASEVVHLSFNAAANDNAQISIVNLMGQIVYSSSNAVCEGENLYNINVANLADGIYMLNIRTNKGMASKKLVIR